MVTLWGKTDSCYWLHQQWLKVLSCKVIQYFIDLVMIYSSPCQSKVTYVCIYINKIGITSLKTTSATRLYKDLDILDTWKLTEMYGIYYISSEMLYYN